MIETAWLAGASHLFAALPAWKKSLIMVASCSVVGGLGLQGIGSVLGDPDPASGEEVAARGAESPGGGWPSATPPDDLSLAQPADAGPRRRATGFADPDPARLDPGDSRVSVSPESGREEGSLLPPDPLVRRFPEDPTTEVWGGPRVDRTAGPAERGGAPGAEESAIGRWSPTLIQGGFAFFAAFCAGLALRTFAKITLIVVGLVILSISGLSQAELVEVHWERIATQFDSITGMLRSEAGSVQSFLRGSLPAGVMGSLGLITGLKRR